MANNNHLVYITENGNLRTTPFDTQVQGDAITLTCKPQEKYLITGFIFLGQVVDSSIFPIDLVTAGFKPLEIFMFRSSNKMFQVIKDEFRAENTEFQVSFKMTKEMQAYF